MRSRFKSKKLKGAAVALLLLPLCVMGCAGNSDAQSEAPLSPYELENMIMSNDADIADILSDIQEIKAALADIEATDYSDEVADILSRLADIEARLNPTPTPTATTPSGSPVPTATPAGSAGITADLTQTEIREAGTYNFDVSVTAGASSLSKYVILEITPTTTDKPDITGTPTLVWTGTPLFACTMSPSGTNCELIRFVSDSKVLVPAGTTHTYAADYTFAYSGGTPVGWTYNWYLSDTQ